MRAALNGSPFFAWLTTVGLAQQGFPSHDGAGCSMKTAILSFQKGLIATKGTSLRRTFLSEIQIYSETETAPFAEPSEIMVPVCKPVEIDHPEKL